MNTLIIAALLSSAFAATTRSEAYESQIEISMDYDDIRDDTSDLRSLEAIISNWESASRRGATGSERAADRALESWLRREIKESQQELSQARTEVRASKNELRQELKEANNAHGRNASQEKAEARDDARDLKDDRRDLSAMETDLRKVQQIASQLNSMQPKFENGRANAQDYRIKSNLLDQLRSLARWEIRQDQEELSEDQGERREARWD